MPSNLNEFPKKLGEITIQGEPLSIWQSCYSNEKGEADPACIAIILAAEAGGEMFAVLSVNVEDSPPSQVDSFWVKTWGENAPWYKALLTTGLFEDCGVSLAPRPFWCQSPSLETQMNLSDLDKLNAFAQRFKEINLARKQVGELSSERTWQVSVGPLTIRNLPMERLFDVLEREEKHLRGQLSSLGVYIPYDEECLPDSTPLDLKKAAELEAEEFQNYLEHP